MFHQNRNLKRLGKQNTFWNQECFTNIHIISLECWKHNYRVYQNKVYRRLRMIYGETKHPITKYRKVRMSSFQWQPNHNPNVTVDWITKNSCPSGTSLLLVILTSGHISAHSVEWLSLWVVHDLEIVPEYLLSYNVTLCLMVGNALFWSNQLVEPFCMEYTDWITNQLWWDPRPHRLGFCISMVHCISLMLDT